MLKYKIGEIEH